MSKSLLKAICRVLAGVVLFAQFSVATYACPGLEGMMAMASKAAMATPPGVDSTGASDGAHASMPPGCDQMDAGPTNLCAEHCHQGQQSADTAAVPEVAVGVPAVLYSLPFEPQHAPDALGSRRSRPAFGADLAAAPEPPHAILHCVFRI